MSGLSMLDENKIAVIAAVGEVCHRPENPSEGREPVILMGDAISKANEDLDGQLFSAIDRVEVVGQVTWRYRDPVSLLCEKLGIHPNVKHNASMGGDTPTRLVHEAALAIASGESQVTVIVGGESVAAKRKAAKEKINLDWTPRCSVEETVVVDEQSFPVHADVKRVSVVAPAHCYPLYEMANQHARGITPGEGLKESAELWHQFASVAEKNPYAWIKQAPSAQTIQTQEGDNRLIAYPYSKLMVANSIVNQSAAIVVCSLAWAKSIGLQSNQVAYIQGGAIAREPDDFLDRDQFVHSHAQDAVLDEVVRIAGGSDQFDAVEIYSCFPVVPKLALARLQLPPSIAPTVTGGLTFFGGPMNNFMAHAVGGVFRKLVAGEASKGLLYANGGFLTKHHALILGNQPPEQPLPPNFSVQEQVNKRYGPVPEYCGDYIGASAIETFTLPYDKLGLQNGFVVLRTADGRRTVATVRADDSEGIASLLSPSVSPIGQSGEVYVDAFGDRVWSPKRITKTQEDYRYCTVTTDNHITTITINRPDKRNALNPQANEELALAFDAFEQDPDQWVAIITGAGDAAFCSGNDLKQTASLMSVGRRVKFPVTGFGGICARWNLNKPVIAAVNGVAMGGGFEIALACDLVIASDNAVFGLTEPKVGLAALEGGLLRLSRQIGLKQAMAMILTGKTVPAVQGVELGFVNEVVPSTELMPRAIALAEEILACSPLSVRGSKQIVMQGMDEPDMATAYRNQRQYSEVKKMFRSADLREGPKAFAEKRKPVWKGR